MAQIITVKLSRSDNSPLGFRLQGGKDFGCPLVIQKVNGGSAAERAGLIAGDSLIKVNNTDVFNLRHKDAQDVIIRAGQSFELTVQRGGSTWKPHVTPAGNLPSPSPAINNISPVTKTSLAAKPQSFSPIGSSHNATAQGFNSTPHMNGNSDGPKLVNKQYNSPIGLYSEESIAETLSSQAEVLSTGALGVNFKKNEKIYNAANSEVLKMLHETEKEHSEPVYDEQHYTSMGTRAHMTSPRPLTPVPQKHSQHESGSGEQQQQQHQQQQQNHQQQQQQSEQKPEGKLPTVSDTPICSECERAIVGVFVRIKDKNLHVECFKCSTCGTSLKNVGYYNINNKLYCDIHAKLAAKSNPSAPNMVPITVAPGAKAPAGAISAALASHSLPSPSPLSPSGNAYSPSFPPPFPTLDTTDALVQQDLRREEAVCGLMSALTVAKVKQMKDSSTNTNGTFVSEAIIPINGNNVEHTSNGHGTNGHGGHNLNGGYGSGYHTNGHGTNGHGTNGHGTNGQNAIRYSPNNGNNENGQNDMYATVSKIKYVPKSGGSLSGPKPFTSISPVAHPVAPVSAPIAPKAPAPPMNHSAPAMPARKEWPPRKEEEEIPTACPLYIPPKPSLHSQNIPITNQVLKKNVGTQQTNYEPNQYEQKKINVMKQQEEFVSTSHGIDSSQISNDALAHKMSICSTEVRNIVEQFSAIQTIAEVIDNTILVESIKQRPKTPPPLKPKVFKPIDTSKQPKKQIPQVKIDQPPTQTQNIEELVNTCCGRNCDKNCKKGGCGNPKCRATKEKSPLKSKSPIKKAKSPTRYVCPLKQKDCPLFVDKLEDRNTVTKTVKLKSSDKNKKSKMSTVTSEMSTVIQNPVPQQWVSPMVKALTIASDKPFNAVSIDIKTIERHPMPIESTQTRVSEVSAVIETQDYMKEHHSEEIQQIIEGHQHHSEETKNPNSPFHHEVRITPEILAAEMTQGTETYQTQSSESYKTQSESRTEQTSFVQESYQEIEKTQTTTEQKQENGISFPFKPNAPQPSSPFARALTIAPDTPFNPTPQIHLDPVPLPEFMEPYFPSARPIVVEPHVPKKPQEEVHTPFVEALTTAPDRPYSPLPQPVKKKSQGPPVPEFMKDLPLPPKEPISMLAALTVAADRPFTPVLYGQEQQSLQIAHVVEPSIQPPKPKPPPVVVKKVMSPLPAKPASHIMPSAFIPVGTTTFKPVLESYNPEQHVQPEPPRSFPPVTPELKQSYQRASEFGSQPQSPKVVEQAKSLHLQEVQHQQLEMYHHQVSQQELAKQQRQSQQAMASQQQRQELAQQQKAIEEQHRMYQQRAQQEMAQKEMAQQQEQAYQHMLQQQKAQQLIANQQLVQQKIIQEQMSQSQSQMTYQQQVSNEEQYHRQEQSRRHAMSKQPAQVGLHKADDIPSYQKNLPTATYIQPSTAPLKTNIQQYQQQPGNYDQHDQPQIKIMQEPIKKPVTTIKPGQYQSNVPHQTFQPVGDDHETHNGKVPHFPAHPISPSMINKPAPSIPHYQADIVAHQCLAVKSELFDPRSPGISRSPSPILGRSAAQYGHRIERVMGAAAGPPPDPLAGRRSKTPTMMSGEQYFEAKEKVTHFIPAYQDREQRRMLRTPEINIQQAETVEEQYHAQQQQYQSQQTQQQMQYQQSQKELQERQYQEAVAAEKLRQAQQTQERQFQEARAAEQMKAQQMQYQQTASAEKQYQIQQQPQSGPIEEFQSQQINIAEKQYQPQQSGYSMSDSAYAQYQSQYQSQSQVGQQTTRIQASEDVKHLEQKAKAESQTVEMSPDSRVQIQRTKKCTEEFERTQKVKTIEIERSSTGATQIRSSTQSVPGAQMQAPQIRYDPPHDIQMYNAQDKKYCAVESCEKVCQNVCTSQGGSQSYTPTRQVQYGTSSIANFESRQQKFNQPGAVPPKPTQFSPVSAPSKPSVSETQYSPEMGQRQGQSSSAFEQYSAFGQRKSSGSGASGLGFSTSGGQQFRSAGSSAQYSSAGGQQISSVGSSAQYSSAGVQQISSAGSSAQYSSAGQQFSSAEAGQQFGSSGQKFSSVGVGQSSTSMQQKAVAPQYVQQKSVPQQSKPVSMPKVSAPKKPVAPNVSSSQGGPCVKKTAYQTTMPKSQNPYFPRQPPPVSPLTRFQKSVTNPTGPKIITIPLAISPTPLSHTKQCYQPSTMTPSPIPGYSPSPLAVSPAPGAKPQCQFSTNKITNVPKSVKPVSVVTNPNVSTTKNLSGQNSNISPSLTGTGSRQSGAVAVGPKRGRGVLNVAAGPGSRVPVCGACSSQIRGPFITALGKIWCPEHFICTTPSCRRPLQDLGFVEEQGQLYCEFCFEQYLAPVCAKCNTKIKGDCLNAIGKHFHPECFLCAYCGKLFGNTPFFLEDGLPYCEADWNELFTTKCFACGFPVEAGDRWVEALNNNYHSQCFNCTMCKKNLEGQSFYAKGGRPFCKNHAR